MVTDRTKRAIGRIFKRRLIPLIAIAVGFSPVAAFADVPYDRCVQSASRSSDYNSCGQAWLKREEVGLTTAWRKTYGSLDTAEAKSALLAEQRKWIVYKDSACRFLGTSEFGSMGWSQKMLPCMARIVESRIVQLEDYAGAGGEGGQ